MLYYNFNERSLTVNAGPVYFTTLDYLGGHTNWGIGGGLQDHVQCSSGFMLNIYLLNANFLFLKILYSNF